jgi:NADH:ubiquinone oxidoreductase subunit 3 (subunit A)
MKKYIPYIIIAVGAIIVFVFIYLKNRQVNNERKDYDKINNEQNDKQRRKLVYEKGYQNGCRQRKSRRAYNSSMPLSIRNGDEQSYKDGYDAGWNDAKKTATVVTGQSKDINIFNQRQ